MLWFIGHGEIQFASEKMMVNESNGTAEIKIIRLGGASGQVGVTVETYNLTATDRVDYVGLKSNWKHTEPIGWALIMLLICHFFKITKFNLNTVKRKRSYTSPF